LIDQRPTLWRAGCAGTRTSGSEGGGEQTTTRKRGTAARLRPYFSILERKALTPKDFDSLDQLAERIIGFQHHWEQLAEPFEWNFTRGDLDALMIRLADRETQLPLAA
jgi:hypothetical protein